MTRRGKLEITRDILEIIQSNRNSIKPTPLLRRSNLSTKRFSEYTRELLDKKLIKKIIDHNNQTKISLTEKGFRFVEKYKTIIDFIDEFEL